jgi:hypothetical protein
MKYINDKKEYDTEFKVRVRKKALKTALDTRKFEIELYWKRATYFWAFIVASLTAYFVLLNSSNFSKISGFTIVISAIGFFFSLGWYFVNRGSKHWQENWEQHVAFLEVEFQGPLFGYVKNPKDPFSKLFKGYPFSVSKINQILSIIMTVFWFGTFVFSIFLSFDYLYYFNDISENLFWCVFVGLTFFFNNYSIFF